jgi:hypothetical protein
MDIEFHKKEGIKYLAVQPLSIRISRIDYIYIKVEVTD